MKILLTMLFIIFLSIAVFAINVNQASITIEETGKQLVDNTVESITVAGYFYLSDNIPHAFQITLTGDDVKVTKTEIKARAKSEIKKVIKGFKKNQDKNEVKDSSFNESYIEDISQ